MGVELELYVLLAVLILGSSIFAVFEVETAWWRKALKWLIVSAATVGLYYAVGHYTLMFLVGPGSGGAPLPRRGRESTLSGLQRSWRVDSRPRLGSGNGNVSG